MRIVWTSDAKSEYRQRHFGFGLKNNDTDKCAMVIECHTKGYLDAIKKYPDFGRIVSEKNKYWNNSYTS